MHCMASSFFISNKPNLAPMSHTSTRLGHAHFLGQVRWQFVSYFSTFSVFCFFFAFGFCFFSFDSYIFLAASRATAAHV